VEFFGGECRLDPFRPAIGANILARRQRRE
jgi:hypothetical protein